jgi:SAM-dependent methyltransferase
MVSRKSVRICAVCGSDKVEFLHHQRFADYDASPLPTSYDVVACTSCGFAFADTPATQADYDHYYRDYSKYEDTRVASGAGLGEWELQRFRQTAGDIVRFLPDTNASLLDVGAAGGGLLTELYRLGFRNLHGMDHAPGCVDTMVHRGFSAYLGGITDLPPVLAGRRFEGVALSHVLEHLRDLEGALRGCAELLADGGVLYLETPDSARYSEYTVVPFYFFDCEHINHFSLDSLRNLTERFGFTFLEGAPKTFLASATTAYPAVWAAFRRTRAAPPRDPLYTPRTRDGILGHLAKSQAALAMPEIEALAVQGAPVIVWGAGSYAQRLLENSPLGRCNISYFVDNDHRKLGNKLNGIEIRLPEGMDNVEMPILVCAALFSHDIRRQIEAMGIDNPVISLSGGAATAVDL